jgi:secreted Zn-dependent insulinase-like peptidase
MSLVLIGNFSLDQLQTMAAANFSSIENHNVKLPDYSSEVLFDTDRGLGHFY